MTVETFIAEYIEVTEQNPFAKYERVWDGKAAFDLRVFGGNVRFSLRSLERGKGHGSLALDWLCGLADAHHVMLTGNAVPFGKTGKRLTVRELKKWYARHGFLVSRSGELAKLPSKG